MSLFRITLAIFALTATYLGFEEARLAIHCSSLESFEFEELQKLALREGPVWADVETRPAISPGIAPRNENFDRYLPVRCDEDRYGSALVFVIQPAYSGDVIEERSGAVRASGLSYVPPADLEHDIRFRLEAGGHELAPGFRVLEVGRKPAPLAAAAALFAGIVTLSSLLLQGLRRRRGTILVDADAVRANIARKEAEKERAEAARVAPARLPEPEPSESAMDPVPTVLESAPRRLRSPRGDGRRRELVENADELPVIQEVEVAAAFDFLFGADDESTVDLEHCPLPSPEDDVTEEDDLEGAVSTEVTERSKRVSRFQEFDDILTFARPRSSSTQELELSRRESWIGRSGPGTEAALLDDETLAILDSCELSGLPGADLLESVGPSDEISTDLESAENVRLLGEAPRRATLE